jgi:aromatic ring-opening dioxygenase LigB subunit
MKYWLIIFFFTPEGGFVEKKEVRYKNEFSCYYEMAKEVEKKQKLKVHMYCVTDDHYQGRKQDYGIPLEI